MRRKGLNLVPQQQITTVTPDQNTNTSTGRYETFGNVIREVKNDLTLNERQLELVMKRQPNTGTSTGTDADIKLRIKRVGTGKSTRRHLITFPKGEPLVINGREYTRNEIARAVDCDIAHISKIFKAERTPSLFMARKIANFLGMSTDQFYDILTRIDVGQLDDEANVDMPRGFQTITT